MSPCTLQALLNYEDRWFDWHPGINPLALVRALEPVGAAWACGVGRLHADHASGPHSEMNSPDIGAEGGPAPRTVGTKLRQMARALQLEWHLSKHDILTLYLNHAPMGGQVQGVEMASRAYLGKPALDLSHAEAALLVALPQSPSRLRPDRAPGTGPGRPRQGAATHGQPGGVARAHRDRCPAGARVCPALRAAGWLRWRLSGCVSKRCAQQLSHPQPRRPQPPHSPHQPRRRHNSQYRSSAVARNAATAVVRSTLDARLQIRLEQMLLDRLAICPLPCP